MDDLINRQAAIEALCDICPALKINGRCMFGGSQDCEDVKCLMSLPPAEPAEIIRCKDCKWWDKKDDSPYGYCHAVKHGYHSSNWEIGIYRLYKSDFFCADGERSTDD